MVQSKGKITVIIPDNIYSINPSFFEELFINAVSELGREGFFEKFEFKCLGDYNYEKTLSESVNRVLREKEAFSKFYVPK